ncbi:MAG: hypothetical protein Q9182_005092 [Xanthomendoza sp. 2 TL-2023]
MKQHVSQSTTSTSTYSSLLGAQYSEPLAADETDEQAQLNGIRERQYCTWPKSRYSDVSVLLLKWASDNLGVIHEVVKLKDLLQNRFNFACELWNIPSEDPEDELTQKILRFRKGKQHDSLILLYYAGHGDGNPDECIWAATNAPDSPSLNWHNIQGHLLGHPCHTMFVLDCCYASLAVSNHSTGDNWFLGASVKESQATGVSWKSFTSAMTRKLERAANKYWDDKKTYNVQSLSHDLNLWEQDLPVTPHLVRLTSQHCEPTDLTPLLYPRARPMLASARTEPVIANAKNARTPSLPLRLPKDRATLAPSPASQCDEKVEQQTLGISIEIPMIEACQTVRINGLWGDAEPEDIVGWLEGGLKTRLENFRLGPVIRVPSTQIKRTVATFPSVALVKHALEIWGEGSSGGKGRQGSSVTMDIRFRGLTTIYDSAKARGEPNADIVIVHGAFAHPINGFASHYVSSSSDSTSTETCWPRDEIPEMLEARGIFPRVLTYGWPADLWLNPHEKVPEAAENLRLQLHEARRAASTRPLVFIGHGFGGVLIKEVVNTTIIADLRKDRFDTSVKFCCFLATPHREVDQHEDFASILAAMNAVQDPKPRGFGNPSVQALKALNPMLRDISTSFDGYRNEYGIAILSAAESVETNDRFVVPEGSALFTNSPKERMELDCNYRDLARLPATVTKRGTGLGMICDKIVERLKPSSNRSPEDIKKREKVYGRLRKYDTVFLVDDSGSMSGRRWYTASKVLADVAAIAVKYDKDGVDLKFFNAYLEEDERKNINTSEKVMELFSKVEPDGPTLTADLLEEELNEYMYQYQLNRSKKGLNLIILTDGEPDGGQDVEAVIVKYAKKLHDVSAPLFQVGIQFVQIGADSTATSFLQTLDTELKEKYNLDRDMVDTVLWVPGDEDRLFEKILLGGILKELDAEGESGAGDAADGAG